MGKHSGCALQYLVGKQPALPRQFAGHVQFSLNICQYFGFRVAGGVHIHERIKPCFHQLAKQREMNVCLARKVVEYVGLGQPCCFSNLIYRCTAITVDGKHIQSGVQNAVSVALLNAAGFFRLIVRHGRSFCAKSSSAARAICHKSGQLAIDPAVAFKPVLDRNALHGNRSFTNWSKSDRPGSALGRGGNSWQHRVKICASTANASGTV